MGASTGARASTCARGGARRRPLISAIMALGVNMAWGYAGLFNVGIMGFADCVAVGRNRRQLRGGGKEGLDDRVGELIGDQHGLFGREVPEERPWGHAGRVGDVLHVDRVEPSAT